MPEAYIEHLNGDLTCSERHGVIRSMSRSVRVVFKDADAAPGNFNILKAVLDACPAPMSPPPSILVTDDAELPTAIITDPNEPFGQLVLTGRDPKMVGGDKWVYDVTLHYEHILDGPNQKAILPDNGIIFGKGKTSVVDKSTNFYYPFGDTTKARELIAVAHTFDQYDQGIAGLKLDPNLPRTVLQGGEIQLPFPQSNFGFQGIWDDLFNPVQTSFTVVATVNKLPWLGRPALTWMCSEMQWECIEPSKHRYRVNFEFQYNVDTWDKSVVFFDQRTGRPPHDVVKASINDANGVTRLMINPISSPLQFQPAGWWQVPALARLDFDAFFGAFFNGTNPGQVL